MPKCNRWGKAAILSAQQLDELMDQLEPLGRAIFQTARYTAGRISEVLALQWGNIYKHDLVFPKCITKKKVRTREIPMSPRLISELAIWRAKWTEIFNRPPEANDFVFPTKDLTKNIERKYADRLLRTTCAKLGLEGVSTHSFRRSSLAAASDAGLPLRHVMELSGHSSLSVLQEYLSCTEEQKRAVAMAFG